MKFTKAGNVIVLPVVWQAAAAVFAAACQTTGNTNVSTATANTANTSRTGNTTSANSMPSNMGNKGNMAVSKDGEGNENIDVQFIDMMLSPHADGIKMAQMAASKAQNAGVKAFAEKSIAMQREDSQRLEGFRSKFFAGAAKSDHIPMKEREMMMTEMVKMSEADMQKLQSASGAEFDRMFLDVFTKHHQMAVDMAQEEKTRGKQAEVVADAEKNIVQQTKDIGEMADLKKKIGEK